MSFQIKKATRTGVKPLVCLYSESGCGKTFSALLLARGLAGPSGRIVLGDSEQGRGSLYADVIQGGYEVIEIDEPFTPARYIELIEAMEHSGAAVGILDSGSHEWELGVLDMAAALEEKSGKGLHVWRKPKMEHAKFIQKLLRCKIPLVICLRAKYKSRQTKENGKTVIVRDENLSPMQAEDFIFEMQVHGWIDWEHNFHPTKISHPALGECFPNGKPIEIRHGEALARWCAAPGGSSAQSSPKAKPDANSGAPAHVASPASPATTEPDLLAVKRELWAVTQPVHNGDQANAKKLQQWLWDEMCMGDSETLSTVTAVRLQSILEKVKTKLK